MRREGIAHQLELSLRASLQAPALCLLDLKGHRPREDERREPWIPIKYGPAKGDDWFGVVPAAATFARAPGKPAETLNLVVKVNPRRGLSRTLIPWIVEHKAIALDRPYWEYRRAAQSDRTDTREYNIYRTMAPNVPALASVLPRCYGTAIDEASGEHALFLELLTNIQRLDATGAAADWPVAAIDKVLWSTARWQAAYWGETGARDLAFLGPRPTTADMLADAPLWHGLLEDARRRFPQIVTDQVWRRRQALIDSLQDWHSLKDLLPGTLAHNDFNQRNVGFRDGPIVLDWELAERNTAQRDLVELLTFVLPTSAGRAEVDARAEAHRTALIAAGVSTGVDRDSWMEGFRCELKVEAIDRVGLQLLFAAQFPLAYLVRINVMIERLLDLYS